jgi:hypothetical protein
VLPIVIKKKGLGTTFPLVIATTRAYRVNSAPIRFLLWMNFRIAVHFTCRGLKDPCTRALGEAKHINGAVYASLGGLNWIVLIVNRTGWTSEVENAIDFNIQGKCNVMTRELKIGMVKKMQNVLFSTRKIII